MSNALIAALVATVVAALASGAFQGLMANVINALEQVS